MVLVNIDGLMYIFKVLDYILGEVFVNVKFIVLEIVKS